MENNENQNHNENTDYVFLDNKLRDYVEVNVAELNEGDHFRYTSSVYQQFDKRKCIYAIVKKRNDDDTLLVEGYNSPYGAWNIDPHNKFKKLRFYKKK